MSFLLNENSIYAATVLDLINWFLTKEPMSQKKIQKLAYYAQAWSLVFLGRDIVQGITFEAWVHGPVNYSIRTELAECGWNQIKLDPNECDFEHIKNCFTVEQNEVLEEVWRVYGSFSADQLEVITHREEPWLEKRVGLGPYESSNNIISNKTMKNFYSKMVVE